MTDDSFCSPAKLQLKAADEHNINAGICLAEGRGGGGGVGERGRGLHCHKQLCSSCAPHICSRLIFVSNMVKKKQQQQQRIVHSVHVSDPMLTWQ